MLIGVTISFILIIFIVFFGYDMFLNRTSPLINKHAVITDKISKNKYDRGSSFYIVFKLDNSKHIYINVSSEVYDKYTIGDTGELYYQRIKFRDFKLS